MVKTEKLLTLHFSEVQNSVFGLVAAQSFMPLRLN